MNKSWTGLGIGNKNKKGEYLDMYFHPDNIYDSDKIIEKVKSHELVKVSDDTPPTNVPDCLLYTSPSPRDEKVSRMPSSA